MPRPNEGSVALSLSRPLETAQIPVSLGGWGLTRVGGLRIGRVMLSKTAPIGVFDSGVGGLSVLRELRREMPHADFVYLADSAHVPYGTRPDQEICDLTAQAVAWLHAQGVAGVVDACNTSSAFSLDYLRAHYGPQFPIVGLVPAVKPAVKATRSGVVGVLATAGTLRGTLLSDVIAQFAVPAGVEVHTITSPDLVPLVEAGQADSPQTRQVLRELLTPLAQTGADQLVLGCTHFPFLAGAIRAEFGDTFGLLDSGAAVARRTREVLEKIGNFPDQGAGRVRYFATGDPQRAASVMSGLLGEAVTVQAAGV